MCIRDSSYGSLTGGLAVQTPTGVDDLVLVGSPGVGTDHASGLQVPAGHVFVGEARDDPVADLAYFGTDPSSPEFGAVGFQTDGGTDPATGAALTASVGHSQYFEIGSESLRNLALITLGHPEQLTIGDSIGVGDLLVTGRYPIGPR